MSQAKEMSGFLTSLAKIKKTTKPLYLREPCRFLLLTLFTFSSQESRFHNNNFRPVFPLDI